MLNLKLPYHLQSEPLRLLGDYFTGGISMENRLAQIRKEKKIGQGYLVDRLGVSRQTISSIENGRCTPSLELALDLANLLGLPIEELFIHENRFLQKS